MLIFPYIDPVAFSIAGLEFRWYGIMYVIGFLSFVVLGRWRARSPDSDIPERWVEDMMFYGLFGTIIGGRLGYIFFYNFDVFLSDWLIVFRIWEGGMSFHGGLIGVVCALWLFAYKHNRRLLQLLDFCAPLIPLGLGAGRIGNFINGELWGRPSDLPWAMIFPHVDSLPRHPSQLYEMLAEGVLLFIIVWFYSRTPKPVGAVTAVFALSYGLLRFMVEFTREPDAHIGFIAAGWLTTGQLLSIAVFFVGLLIFYSSRQRNSIV